MGFLRRLGGAWVGAPILAKDLRLASRKGWLYALRGSYVGLLGLFTALVWISWTSGLSGGVQASRAADVGKHIIVSIVWFQYLVVQGVTIVLLAGSISGEIRRRTFPILLTTPLGILRIVAEKLAGGVLNVGVLLACCLPLLAIVRVFGGVPWGFVLSSLAVTATACIFAGAVAVYFSIRAANPFGAAALAAGAVAGYHLLGWTSFPVVLIVIDLRLLRELFRRGRREKGVLSPPWDWIVPIVRTLLLLGLLVFALVLNSAASGAWLLLSPTYALYRSSQNMMSPGSLPASDIALGGHCLVLFLVSLGLLRRCGERLAQVARTRAWGLEESSLWYAQADPEPEAEAPHRRFWAARGQPAPVASENPALGTAPATTWPARSDPPRRVPARPRPLAAATERWGSALLWKDTRSMVMRGEMGFFFLRVAPLTALVFAYIFGLWAGGGRSIRWHAVMLTIYASAGALLAAVFAALAISAERQARTWPILLTTPLSDRHILWAKSGGVFYRCLPAWGLLFAHLALAVAFLQVHPLAVVEMAVLAAGVHLLLCGTGFCLSGLLRGTSLPVVANLAVCLLLWVVVPVLCPLVGDVLRRGGGDRGEGGAGLRALQAMTPWDQTSAVVQSCPGLLSEPGGDDSSGQPGSASRRGDSPRARVLGWVALAAGVHASCGLLLLWLAARRLRRNAFA